MNSRFKSVVIFVAMFFLVPVFVAFADEAAEKPAAAEDKASSESAKPVTETATVTEDDDSWSIIDSLWTKVRSVMISDEEVAKGEDVRYSSTAGIRGSKSSSDILKPIWKGRKTDGHMPADVRFYNQAKADFEKGDYESAVSKLKEFQKVYKYSQIRPQAQILLALSYAKCKKQDEAVKALDCFLKDYPGHELCADAKKLKSKMAKVKSE